LNKNDSTGNTNQRVDQFMAVINPSSSERRFRYMLPAGKTQLKPGAPPLARCLSD
jgi:hypothetical protein